MRKISILLLSCFFVLSGCSILSNDEKPLTPNIIKKGMLYSEVSMKLSEIDAKDISDSVGIAFVDVIAAQWWILPDKTCITLLIKEEDNKDFVHPENYVFDINDWKISSIVIGRKSYGKFSWKAKKKVSELDLNKFMD